MTEFEKYTSGAEHAEEIKKTRIGGLGGSDAALVYRVGLNGLAGLTNTDNERLAVMLGMVEPHNFGGNIYTRSGHLFEDWYDYIMEKAFPDNYEREFVLTRPFSNTFKVFAHADFVTGNFMCPNVYECKFVTTKSTDEVLKQYEAQLQWYYMLGAESVTLVHGTGQVCDEDGNGFWVDDTETIAVERDAHFVNVLIDGINTLDKAIADGWRPEVSDKIAFEVVPQNVHDAIVELDAMKREDEERKARKESATKIVKEYIETSGLVGISGNDDVYSVVYTKASVTKSFDTAKFLKDHPEYNDEAKYWKTTPRSSSISLK